MGLSVSGVGLQRSWGAHVGSAVSMPEEIAIAQNLRTSISLRGAVC